jgi:hypothetical protein
MKNFQLNFDQQRFMLRYAILVALAVAGFAAVSWKDLSVIDGYSESLGVSVPVSDRETLNSLNCYDTCSAIWGRYANDAHAAPRAAN